METIGLKKFYILLIVYNPLCVCIIALYLISQIHIAPLLSKNYSEHIYCRFYFTHTRILCPAVPKTHQMCINVLVKVVLIQRKTRKL